MRSRTRTSVRTLLATMCAAVLAAALLAAAPGAAWADPGATGTIAGVVRDTTGAPVSGAHVSTPDGSHSATSGADGSYEIADLPPGPHDISFDHPDFARFQYRGQESGGTDPRVVVVAGATARADMVMYRHGTLQVDIGMTAYGDCWNCSMVDSRGIQVVLQRRIATASGLAWVEVNRSWTHGPRTGHYISFTLDRVYLPGTYRVLASSLSNRIAPTIGPSFEFYADGLAGRTYLHVYVPTDGFDFIDGQGADILARTSAGALLHYPTDGWGSWRTPRQVNAGWQMFDKVFAAGDFTHSGGLDLLARTYDGRLMSYATDGAGRWGWRDYLGYGWGMFDMLFSPRDFTGDGRSDVMGRTPNGLLYLYTWDSVRSWTSVSVIGSGWQMFDSVFPAGDFDGDGYNDILARTPSGLLYLYPGDGTGGWLQPRVIGSGWQMFDRIFTEGDFDGDGRVDLLAKTPAGLLYLYPTDGTTGWLTPRVIGSGWNGLSIVG